MLCEKHVYKVLYRIYLVLNCIVICNSLSSYMYLFLEKFEHFLAH